MRVTPHYRVIDVKEHDIEDQAKFESDFEKWENKIGGIQNDKERQKSRKVSEER
ncbi:MAG: hypothetical protein KAS04_04530 [Candidatus Aenigmarchaeota archaeon]|nr:hypothetical protein [Candidatus Aenigmarchaeota archaeon]